MGDVLQGDECTQFRALAARAMYLSLDHPDIMCSAKELYREFSCPTQQSVVKLKRLTRYLVKHPRLVWRFDHAPSAKSLDTYVGTEFAGCWRTRRSTSGGVSRLGRHVIKH